MSDIVFARVDDRLIHGQVVFRWMDYVGAAELVIVDDELCKDTFIYRVFRSMLAPGIDLQIISVQNAIQLLRNKTDYTENRKMLLAKSPIVYRELVENKVELKQVNIGCMGHMKGRKNYYKDLYASTEEIDAIHYLIQENVNERYQVLVSNVKEKLCDINEKTNM